MTNGIAILMIHPNGRKEYVKSGDLPARFANMRAAREQVTFLEMGLERGVDYQSLNVVPYPKAKT